MDSEKTKEKAAEVGDKTDKRMEVQYKVNCIKDSMVGGIYRHFKGNTYIVIDIAVHSETEEPMVIYNSADNLNLTWCRPLEMFLAAVDHEKYPDVTQKLRFERIGESIRKSKYQNGYLMESPCKVDDVVYVPHRGKIEELRITSISFYKNGIYFSWTLQSGIYPWLDGFTDNYIGEKVFLTKAEAEQKIKEIKKGI